MNDIKRKILVGVLMAGISSGLYFSQRTKIELTGVKPDLVLVAACAKKELKGTDYDFEVIDGVRTSEEQKVNVQKGVSWTLRSKHLTGDAFDFMARYKGKLTFNPDPYRDISKVFIACGDQLGTPVTWGGIWKAKDLMHIERKK